jgi:ribosome maturation factor RimP
VRDTSANEQVQPVVAAALTPLQLLAEEVTVTAAGRRSVLRVAVDRDIAAMDLPDDSSPVEPLTLDEVAEATKAVSVALDDSDAMGERAYVLEVTSPGIDRPLTLPRHFRRNTGRKVAVMTRAGTSVTGRIRAATPQTLHLVVEAERGADTSVQLIPMADIAKAAVQVEFTHAAQEED